MSTNNNNNNKGKTWEGMIADMAANAAHASAASREVFMVIMSDAMQRAASPEMTAHRSLVVINATTSLLVELDPVMPEFCRVTLRHAGVAVAPPALFALLLLPELLDMATESTFIDQWRMAVSKYGITQ